MAASDALIARFVEALEKDISILKEVCAPDCKVWHSNDELWVDQAPALESFIEGQKLGLIPPFDAVTTLRTENGFLARTAVELANVGRTLVLQLMTVEDDKITKIEEYISPQADFAAAIRE